MVASDTETKLQLDRLSSELARYLDFTEVDGMGHVYQIIKKALVAKVEDLIIEVYPADHPPWHFHVKSTQRYIDARFLVENLSLYKGDTIDPKSYAKIVDFFKQSTDARMRLNKLCTRFFVSKF